MTAKFDLISSSFCTVTDFNIQLIVTLMKHFQALEYQAQCLSLNERLTILLISLNGSANLH